MIKEGIFYVLKLEFYNKFLLYLFIFKNILSLQNSKQNMHDFVLFQGKKMLQHNTKKYLFEFYFISLVLSVAHLLSSSELCFVCLCVCVFFPFSADVSRVC